MLLLIPVPFGNGFAKVMMIVLVCPQFLCVECRFKS
jgi:hypothetical protein